EVRGEKRILKLQIGIGIGEMNGFCWFLGFLGSLLGLAILLFDGIRDFLSMIKIFFGKFPFSSKRFARFLFGSRKQLFKVILFLIAYFLGFGIVCRFLDIIAACYGRCIE